MCEKVLCPHCGREANLVSQKVVYGKVYGRGGKLWVCSNFPECDSYVGCHASSSKPLGTLANAEQRQLRKQAHALFDPLWRKGEMSRTAAYSKMAEMLEIPEHEAHISQLSSPQLEKLIRCLSREIADDDRITHINERLCDP